MKQSVISQGDLVQVVTGEGIKFNGIIVKDYDNAMYLRSIFEETTKYRPGCADISLNKTKWSRYGIHSADGVFLKRSDCRSITLLRKASRTETSAPFIMNSTIGCATIPLSCYKVITYTVADDMHNRLINFSVIDTPQGEFGAFTQCKRSDVLGQVSSQDSYISRLASAELAQIYSILHSNGSAGKYELK